MNQKGFSSFVVLIIALAAVIIGCIAYVQFVYLPKMAGQSDIVLQSTPSSTALSPAQSTTTTIVQTTTKPVSTSAVPSITTCDNYKCLITAASQCQPISVTVSYSNMPFPGDSDASESGQIIYKIQKSSGTDNCTLISSSPVTVVSMSQKGRAAALAQGMTDAQITAQLQTINNSLKSEVATQSKSTCIGNVNSISSYLTDMENKDLNAEVQAGLTGATATYTTSSGQKLVCTFTLPAGQLPNTSTTITNAECIAQNGKPTEIAEDTGTACFKNQTDLGTVTDGIKVNSKYPQCCVSK